MSNNRVMSEVVSAPSQEDDQIYLPSYVISSISPSSVTTTVRNSNKETDIKTKKSSFRLDLQPIIHENNISSKLSPDSKNLLNIINGSTPTIHLSPAADLEKLLPSGSFLLAGSTRNTPTTPPGVSFLLSNSDVTEESKEFADSFTQVYANLLQQETQKEEPGNGSQLIDISQSLVQPSLTLTPTLSNNQTSSSRVYIIAQQQIPQESLNSLASNGQLTVSVPQHIPNITTVVPSVPQPENTTSVPINGVNASQPLTVNDFQNATNVVSNTSRRQSSSNIVPSVSPSLNDPRSCKMDTSPSIDAKMSDVESTNSSADASMGNGTEMTKLERKRARNRDAARRCRDRKMHKIVSLEQKVKQLNDENRRLKNKQCEQREQLVRLKAIALEHFKKGCRFDFDLTRVDAVLSSPLKKEPDSANFDDGAI